MQRVLLWLCQAIVRQPVGCGGYFCGSKIGDCNGSSACITTTEDPAGSASGIGAGRSNLVVADTNGRRISGSKGRPAPPPAGNQNAGIKRDKTNRLGNVNGGKGSLQPGRLHPQFHRHTGWTGRRRHRGHRWHTGQGNRLIVQRPGMAAGR